MNLKNPRKLIDLFHHRYNYSQLSLEEKRKFVKFFNLEDPLFLENLTLFPNFLSPGNLNLVLVLYSYLLFVRGRKHTLRTVSKFPQG